MWCQLIHWFLSVVILKCTQFLYFMLLGCCSLNTTCTIFFQPWFAGGAASSLCCAPVLSTIQWCWELLTLPQEGGRAEVVTVMASIWWERRRGEYHVNSCLVLYCQEWNYPGLQAGQSQLLKGLLKEVYTYLLPVRSGNFLLKNGNEIVIVLLCVCISTNYIAKDSVFPVTHIG